MKKMNWKMNSVLRRCKTLSTQLTRSSSYTSLRSKSSRLDRNFYDDDNTTTALRDSPPCHTVFVGSSRRRYLISSKYLTHPLLAALIHNSNSDPGCPDICVKCEVVMFDHLLWMLQNADPNLGSDSNLEELAQLYAY